MSFEDLMDAFNSGDEVSCYKTMKVRDFIEFNPKESLKKGELATKVTMDKLLPFEKFISSMEQAPFSGGSKFKNGDTLLARITPCLENGKTAFVDGLKDGEVAFGSTEFIVLRCREGVSDPQYIYYLATSSFFRNVAIKSMVGSSGRQRVQIGALEDIDIKVPSLEEQRKIASRLALLDSKIALNSRINDNLSALAKLLTRRFHKETLESPKKYVPLSEIATFENGYSYKSVELQASSVAMATIGNFTRDGEFKTEGFKEIVIGKKIRPSQYIVEGDVVVAHTDVTQAADIIGRAIQILDLNGYDQAIFSCDLVKVTPMMGYSHSFMAALLSSREFYEHCKGYTNGTTVLHLGKTALPQYVVTLPKDETKIDELSRALERITCLRSKLIKENRTLRTTRDTLLRKLIRV